MGNLKKIFVTSIILIASSPFLHAKSDADIDCIQIQEMENIVIDNYNRLEFLEKVTNELIRRVVRLEDLVNYLGIEEVEA